MKKFILIFVFILSGVLLGQDTVEKGTMTIGSSFDLNSGYDHHNGSDRTSVRINPGFDYFISQNLSLGVRINYQTYFTENTRSGIIGFGPSLKYYFNFDRFTPFIGLNYTYAEKARTIQYHSLTLSVGINYFITNKISIESTINYSLMKIWHPKTSINKAYTRDASDLFLGIGINYYLK